MPESKTDTARRTRVEVDNYVECGDARGTDWLVTHPDAAAHAAAVLAERAERLHPHGELHPMP